MTAPNPLVLPTTFWSVTEMINSSHKFVIQGYSLAKGMGLGKQITSAIFTMGGYQWAIYIYPDGKNLKEHSAYVSVFITLASEVTDVRALFELTLVYFYSLIYEGLVSRGVAMAVMAHGLWRRRTQRLTMELKRTGYCYGGERKGVRQLGLVSECHGLIVAGMLQPCFKYSDDETPRRCLLKCQ